MRDWLARKIHTSFVEQGRCSQRKNTTDRQQSEWPVGRKSCSKSDSLQKHTLCFRFECHKVKSDQISRKIVWNQPKHCLKSIKKFAHFNHFENWQPDSIAKTATKLEKSAMFWQVFTVAKKKTLIIKINYIFGWKKHVLTAFHGRKNKHEN